MQGLVKGLKRRGAAAVSVHACVHCLAVEGGKEEEAWGILFVCFALQTCPEQIKGFSLWGAGGSEGPADLELLGHLHPRFLDEGQ